MRRPFALSAATVCLTLVMLLVPQLSRSQAPEMQQAVQKEDCYGFQLTNLHVKHQGPNVIRLSVLYRYSPSLKPSDYMDVNELRQMVLDAVKTYPNTTDYWEVYSARIADSLFAHYYNQIDALRLQLDIAPDKGAEPFARTSLVTRAHPSSLPLIP